MRFSDASREKGGYFQIVGHGIFRNTNQKDESNRRTGEMNGMRAGCRHEDQRTDAIRPSVRKGDSVWKNRWITLLPCEDRFCKRVQIDHGWMSGEAEQHHFDRLRFGARFKIVDKN